MKTRTKSVLQVLLLVLTVSFLVTGCKEEPKKTEKKIGQAGSAVQMFLRNMEFKRYEQMHAQTVNSREKLIFVQSITQTPIVVKNAAVLSDRCSDTDGDCEVNVSMDVTDITSAFAAYIVNLRLSRDPDSTRSPFFFSPNILGIEKFIPIRQTWRVVKLDGAYFIDMGAGGEKTARHENIMNYVLDAGVTEEDINKKSVDEKIDSASMWLIFLSMDLNLSPEEMKTIIRNSAPLVDASIRNLSYMAEKMKANGVKSKTGI
ncbi:MAG: hypothetical protein WC819_04245 [Parcubacteria group bacterium]|jgi:hypothetical protein